jgi:Holliday junction resolvase RusA-like endonuclease
VSVLQGRATVAREPHKLEVAGSTPAPASSRRVSFFVPGVPSPGGSKRAFRLPNGRVVVTEDARRSKPWWAVVQLVASEHCAVPLEGALRLEVTFILPRPKGHFGKRGIRDSAPEYPTTRPDTTKLLRALEDACTKIVWKDDAQIVQQEVDKEYGDNPGALVVVRSLEVTRHG